MEYTCSVSNGCRKSPKQDDLRDMCPHTGGDARSHTCDHPLTERRTGDCEHFDLTFSGTAVGEEEE